jgi:amidase
VFNVVGGLIIALVLGWVAGEVTARLDLVRGKQGTWPITELRDAWVVHGTHFEFMDAMQLACEEAARLLVDEWGMSMEDAFIFLSVACDVGIAQACKPGPGFETIARVVIPRIDAIPGPFAP